MTPRDASDDEAARGTSECLKPMIAANRGGESARPDNGHGGWRVARPRPRPAAGATDWPPPASSSYTTRARNGLSHTIFPT